MSEIGGSAERKQWIVQKQNDDVATALASLAKGTKIDAPDGTFTVVLQQDIPFGHKFALRDLAAGAEVHKYGQVIGAASCPITAGEHVHAHNLESLRGRGDLVKQL